MLIKKLYRKTIDDYHNNEYEILGKFRFLMRIFYIVRPRNVISREAYIVPEFMLRLRSNEKSMLLDYLRKENKFRGRHYIILC